MSETEGFEFIDKRKINADVEAPAEAAAEPSIPTEGPAEEDDTEAVEPDDEGAELFGEGFHQSGTSEGGFTIPPELLAPDLSSLLAGMVQTLGHQAWWRMGVVAKPGTGQIDRDMAKAKLAIDCAQLLTDKVAPFVPESLARDLRHLISDLQINFVEQSRR